MKRVATKITLMFCVIAMTIGTTSCETQAEKEAKAEAARVEAERTAKEAQPAKYTIQTDGRSFAIDVIAYECDDSGDRIYENECRFMFDGNHSQTFTAQPEAKKLKLYASYNNGSPTMTFGMVEGWVQVAYPLKHGETTVINLDGNTSVGRNMP